MGVSKMVKRRKSKKIKRKRGSGTRLIGKARKQRGTSVKSKDRKRKALPAGRRKTAWGSYYTETRKNRSDGKGRI